MDAISALFRLNSYSCLAFIAPEPEKKCDCPMGYFRLDVQCGHLIAVLAMLS